MKWLVSIALLFTTLACRGQDSTFVYKEKNLLIPNGYIREDKYIYTDIIPKYKEVEIIMESYDFLFTGFEKYGYTLCIDTTDSDKNYINTKIVGYFDLVNNTDSTIKGASVGGWVIDNMGFIDIEKWDTPIKPNESKKIKFVILQGLGRLSQVHFNPPLIPIGDSIINDKISYIDSLNLVERLRSSNAHFRMYNRLTIYGNNDKNVVNVIFIIPVKYIRKIEYSCVF